MAVTLVYDDKQRFRSRALVRVGVPAPTRPWVASYRRDGPATVRALTDDLAGRLRTEAGRYATGGAELAAIAELVVRGGASPPGANDRGAVVDALVQAGRDPDRSAAVSSLLSDHAAYTRLLDGLGLRDTQVAAANGSGRLRRHLVRSVAGLVAVLPLALIGAAVHAAPYAVVKVASGLPTNVGMRATVKVLGSFFLYGLTYGIVGVTVGAWLGAGWGLLAAAAPVCGWLALRTTERIHELGGVVAHDRTALRRRPAHRGHPGAAGGRGRRHPTTAGSRPGAGSLTKPRRPGTMVCTMYRTSTSELLLT